jgi:hypothetical protein
MSHEIGHSFGEIWHNIPRNICDYALVPVDLNLKKLRSMNNGSSSELAKGFQILRTELSIENLMIVALIVGVNDPNLYDMQQVKLNNAIAEANIL